MEIEFEIQSGVGVLQIRGRLNAGNASQLKTRFAEHMDKTTRFVLNLEELEAIDSTGLGAIVSCLKNVSEAGGDLKITSLQSKPRMVFEITRAYRIFDIYDSVDSKSRAHGLTFSIDNINLQYNSADFRS